MRLTSAIFLLGLFSVTSACGGGGSSSGGGQTTTSQVAATSSASSEAISSSSSAVSSSSKSSNSSASSSVATAGLYPSYNTKPLAADATGVGSTAVQLASKIRIGLNIGNTLEATGGKSETYWGNPKITKEFITFVKQSGFNAVRLPTSWDQYSNQTTAEIEAAWLSRVKEVVQYCVD